MKKLMSILSIGLTSLILSGCAVSPRNVVQEQSMGVSTQSRDNYSYQNNTVPQQLQQSRYIPFTYMGKPNEVHYLDTATMPQQSYNVPNSRPSAPVQQSNNNNNNNNNYNNNNNNNYQNEYGNNVSANNAPKQNRMERIINRIIPNSNNNQYNDQYGNPINRNNSNAGVAYVAPTSRPPANGYEWRYNNNYGWGWYNPRSGWYQGW